jgi:hypothetical protein
VNRPDIAVEADRSALTDGYVGRPSTDDHKAAGREQSSQVGAHGRLTLRAGGASTAR